MTAPISLNLFQHVSSSVTEAPRYPDIQELHQLLLQRTSALAEAMLQSAPPLSAKAPAAERTLALKGDFIRSLLQQRGSIIRSILSFRDLPSTPCTGLASLPQDTSLNWLAESLIIGAGLDPFIRENRDHIPPCQSGTRTRGYYKPGEEFPDLLVREARLLAQGLEQCIPLDNASGKIHFATHRLIGMIYKNLIERLQEGHPSLSSHFKQLSDYHFWVSSAHADQRLILDTQVAQASHNAMRPLPTLSKASTPLEQIQERYGLQTLQEWAEFLFIRIEDFAAPFCQHIIHGCCAGISTDLIAHYWEEKRLGKNFLEATARASAKFQGGATMRAELFQLTTPIIPEQYVYATLGLHRLDIAEGPYLHNWKDGTYLVGISYPEQSPSRRGHIISLIIEGEDIMVHDPNDGAFLFKNMDHAIACIERIHKMIAAQDPAHAPLYCAAKLAPLALGDAASTNGHGLSYAAPQERIAPAIDLSLHAPLSEEERYFGTALDIHRLFLETLLRRPPSDLEIFKSGQRHVSEGLRTVQGVRLIGHELYGRISGKLRGYYPASIATPYGGFSIDSGGDDRTDWDAQLSSMQPHLELGEPVKIPPRGRSSRPERHYTVLRFNDQQFAPLAIEHSPEGGSVGWDPSQGDSWSYLWRQTPYFKTAAQYVQQIQATPDQALQHLSSAVASHVQSRCSRPNAPAYIDSIHFVPVLQNILTPLLRKAFAHGWELVQYGACWDDDCGISSKIVSDIVQLEPSLRTNSARINQEIQLKVDAAHSSPRHLVYHITCTDSELGTRKAPTTLAWSPSNSL